jgi:uncharacterized membrane protein YdjX (TVP38/TMEM64 family)
MNQSAVEDDASFSKTRLSLFRIFNMLVVLLLVGTVVLFAPEWTVRDVIKAGTELNSFAFVLTYAILPLLGAPISGFLVIAGLKYDFVGGMLVTFFCMCLHNLVAYRLANTLLRKRITDYLSNRGRSLPCIPQKHQAWFMVVFAAVPGLPYALKLYSMALTNMPFKKYFWLGWPTYVASSFVFIGLGDAAADRNMMMMAVLGGCLAVGFALTLWLKNRTSLSTLDD